MSTTSSIFFEYKDSKDAQWHLIEALVPECFRDGRYDGKNPWPDENHMVDCAGLKKWQMFSMTKQGDVRDLLAGHHSPFNDRGFPKDMSPKLRHIFEGMQARVDELKKTDSWTSDYGWGKSWCLLSEIKDYVNENLEKCKASIFSEHTKQLSFGISKKLDEILAILLGKELDDRKESTDNDEEMMDYYLEERLPELLCIRDFAAGVSFLNEFLRDTYPEDTDIRLIFYAS